VKDLSVKEVIQEELLTFSHEYLGVSYLKVVPVQVHSGQEISDINLGTD